MYSITDKRTLGKYKYGTILLLIIQLIYFKAWDVYTGQLVT